MSTKIYTLSLHDALPISIELLAQAADGDARRALNMLEIALQLAGNDTLTVDIAKEVLGTHAKSFDKGGDIFYEQISALHKSVRGSSPDGALDRKSVV